jgi:hypothetical protein
MRRLFQFLTTIALLGCGLCPVWADPAPWIQGPAEGTSGWFIVPGVSVRSIRAAFNVGSGDEAILNWRSFFTPRAGRGDPGLYQGGNGVVTYDDGFVGGENAFFAGLGADGFVQSASQIQPINGATATNGNLARTVAFSSTGYEYPVQKSPSLNDPEVAAGPSMEFGYRLGTWHGLGLNFLSGWSYAAANHSTGLRQVISVFEQKVDYTYLYDYLANPGMPLSLPGPVNGTDEFILYSLNGLPSFFGSGYQEPRQSADPDLEASPRFYALARADLQVSLHELPFGVETVRQVGPVELALRSGFTLNVIDYNLTSSLAWYEEGVSTPAFAQEWRDASTPLKVGLFGGIAARLPLSQDGRIFVETSGSYRWVDPVHASAGIAEVEIDVSSWEGRIGLGILLD